MALPENCFCIDNGNSWGPKRLQIIFQSIGCSFCFEKEICVIKM